MSNVQLGDKGGGRSSKALANNSRLEILDLSGNDLSTRTATALAESLRVSFLCCYVVNKGQM